MKRNAMSLKAIINNIAKENKVSAQSVLQTYMLERLLERISISKYKDNFILKGGMLISAMLGIDSRTTMDMDTTIKGFKLTEENITNIINEICNIKINDGITFEVQNKVHNLPIYRQGTIASQYTVDFMNEPYFLVDARLHNGMSGSPVVSTENSYSVIGMGGNNLFGIFSEEHEISNEPLELNTIWYAQVLLDITNDT